MSQTAFALREDYQGEIEVELADGTKEQRAIYQGGVLALGPSSVNVGELLEQGNGVIVVEQGQAELVELLAEYGPLKRVGVPDGARAVSLWATRPRAVLLEEARRRGLRGYTSLSTDRLAGVLQRQDHEAGERARAGEPVPEDLQPDADAREIADDAEAEAEETDDGTGNSAGEEGTS